MVSPLKSSIDHIRLQFLRMSLYTAIPDSTTLLVCRYYRKRVLSQTSRRRVKHTTEILISSLSILVLGEVPRLTMSKDMSISVIETRMNVCKLIRKNCTRRPT
jgi:hypothetical protein